MAMPMHRVTIFDKPRTYEKTERKPSWIYKATRVVPPYPIEERDFVRDAIEGIKEARRRIIGARARQLGKSGVPL